MTSDQKTIELLKKYDTSNDDYSNMTLVGLKHDAQTVVHNFASIVNVTAAYMNPEESEALDAAMDRLLAYLDSFIKDCK